MKWIDVLDVSKLVEGQWKIVSLNRSSAGILLRKGEIFAVRNHCPHSGAPICRGRVAGRVICKEAGEPSFDDEALTLRCPWHRWEFDLRSGKPVTPMPGRVQVYQTKIANGRVWICG